MPPLVIPAFIAGILTFLAPCTLPLLPAYLGFISGVSLEDLDNPTRASRTRWKIFLNGAAFIAGFSLIFIAMGTLVAFVGGMVLAPYRLWLTRIGGLFVILFGLFMLNVLRMPFFAGEWRPKVPHIFERGKLINSFVLGSAFAFGWTPCIGPVLGSILFLASISTTALQGAILLLVFSAGLAIPFLLVAVAAGSAARLIGKTAKYLNIVSIIGGAFLVLLGILLITNNTALLIDYGFRIFNFINYDRILDYL
ncbi:MAG: sulfite exporter TauE/SafE family protein [Parcubacteria group bacterium]|nr:sulfite exporter TauE/SafE family protein [Parcubacteria group bacterium]